VTPTAARDARLEVEHVTRYRYATPVSLAHHLAYLRPLDGATQQVEHFTLAIEPAPSHQSLDLDRLGNPRSCFMLDRPHKMLEVRSTSRVRACAAPPLDADTTAPWEAVAQGLRYRAGAPFEPAAEFVHASPYVPALDALHAWAAESFVPGRPVARVGLDLMARLHARMTYSSDSTEVDTPLADVFDSAEGVCQDFAHLLIGALRSHGLAARYVSGYLLTRAPETGASDAPWLGADASHAWVAVWCPMADGSPAHWLELDPTNHVVPSLSHVRVAVGRDYGDVTPLRGVIRGGGEHTLAVSVRTQRLP
jgi:transglutaminase-like putative cysteine protease